MNSPTSLRSPSSRAPVLAVLFVVGASIGVLTELPVAIPRWLAVAVVPVAAWLVGRARGRPQTVLVCAAVILAAIFLGARARAPCPSNPWHASEMATVEAFVATPPVVKLLNGPDARPQTFFSTTRPALRVRVDGIVSDLQPGHHVVLRGRLVTPRGPRNPGDPSPRRESPRLYVPNKGLVDVLEYAPFRAPLQGFVETIRDAAQRRIARLYAEHGETVHGTVLALLVGDRRMLAPSIRDSLRRSGTAHFLAISGVHVGMLFGWLMRVPLPSTIAMPIRLGILMLFALTAGASAPVLRAVLMLSLPCVAEALGRPMRALDGLAWAVILLVAFDPPVILEAGFQLSVLAVFGIVTWSKAFSSDGPHTARRRFVVRQALAVSTAAFLGTAPLIAFYFQSLHPMGILWSVLLFPLIALIVLGASLSLILATVHICLGAPLASVTSGLILALEYVATTMANIPGSCIKLVPPSLSLVALVITGLIGGSLVHRSSGDRRRRRRHLWGLTVLIVCSALAIASPRHRPSHQAWFFDVGAGSAQLLRGPEGEAVLIDVGSSDRAFGLGARLSRSLRTLGLSRLSAIVLTHKDADHVNGVLDLVDNVPTDQVFVSPYFENFDAGMKLIQALETRGIQVQTMVRGTRAEGSTDWTLDALYPVRQETLPLVARSNESSMVLRFTAAGSSILLTADIEEEGTARLLSLDDDLRTDVLVYPHHGRDNRLMEQLLARVRPKWVVLSAGGNASSRRTAAILERRGIHVHATWRDRAGQAVLTAGEWTVRSWDR